jgi:hypothetical protein
MLQIGMPKDFIELDVPELARVGFGNDIMHYRCDTLHVGLVICQHLSQYHRAQPLEICISHKIDLIRPPAKRQRAER